MASQDYQLPGQKQFQETRCAPAEGHLFSLSILAYMYFACKNKLTAALCTYIQHETDYVTCFNISITYKSYVATHKII